MLVSMVARAHHLKVALGGGRVVDARALEGGLLLGGLLELDDVVGELLHEDLEVRLGVHLRLLQGQLLVLELQAQLLQQGDDAARLVLVRVGLRHAVLLVLSLLLVLLVLLLLLLLLLLLFILLFVLL